ncbi:hypothetical protein O9992_03220 [Vibrio lentus]|nr:hypothetical protein [Vibrio lentus]
MAFACHCVFVEEEVMRVFPAHALHQPSIPSRKCLVNFTARAGVKIQSLCFGTGHIGMWQGKAHHRVAPKLKRQFFIGFCSQTFK